MAFKGKSSSDCLSKMKTLDQILVLRLRRSATRAGVAVSGDPKIEYRGGSEDWPNPAR